MRFRKTLTLLPALVVAGCVGTEPGCSGWRQIQVNDATIDYLDQNDREALAALIAHQEAGQRFGCWK